MRRYLLSASLLALIGIGGLALWLSARSSKGERSLDEFTLRSPEPDASSSATLHLGLHASVTEGERKSEGEDEKSALQEIFRLQATDKERALSLVELSEKRFGESLLVEARRAVHITLLVDVGRMKEARSRTREFIARFPKSEYLPLVQGVTGIHPRPGAPPNVVGPR